MREVRSSSPLWRARWLAVSALVTSSEVTRAAVSVRLSRPQRWSWVVTWWRASEADCGPAG
ncbi:hypothetical protein KBI5_24815 [Frankia sp. KB5]|nr:hypothetical protein KBI5_24815 [Frankia sp. KB5]